MNREYPTRCIGEFINYLTIHEMYINLEIKTIECEIKRENEEAKDLKKLESFKLEHKIYKEIIEKLGQVEKSHQKKVDDIIHKLEEIVKSCSQSEKYSKLDEMIGFIENFKDII